MMLLYASYCSTSTSKDYQMSEIERKSESVGLRLRPSLKKALDKLAAADRRPLATYIELALEAHVEAQGSGRKK